MDGPGGEQLERPGPARVRPAGCDDWQGRWIGIDEDPRPGPGARPAYWLRTRFELPQYQQARLYITALGLYEAFLDGQRVGDAELAPGYTQYRARVQYQAYDVTDVVQPGRRVLAVLLADGWYRGQVGLPRAADQFGEHVALRAQLEVLTGEGWHVAAASDPGWRTAPSHITAADLIAGQREDRRRVDPAVHDPAIDETAAGGRSWRQAVARAADVAIVRSIAPPVRRVEQVRPVAVRLVRDRTFVGTSARTSTAGCGWHEPVRRANGWCSPTASRSIPTAISRPSNMCDIPTDCPQRERAGWTGGLADLRAGGRVPV